MKRRPEFRLDQAELYHFFCRTFGTPARVFYPGCGDDTTPGIAFGVEKVVFLDPHKYNRQSVRKSLPGAQFIQMKAEEYESMVEFDLVIDIHSHAPFDDEVKDLRSGGYLIIANKMSDQAFDHPDFTLVGVSNAENIFGAPINAEIQTGDLGIYEIEDEAGTFSPFSNRRKHKARYYIFQKK